MVVTLSPKKAVEYVLMFFTKKEIQKNIGKDVQSHGCLIRLIHRKVRIRNDLDRDCV